MTHEHEIMHAETLLYMLIQSASTRPPTSNALPQWDVLSRMWQKQVESSNLLTIENGSIEYGHDDLEAEDPKFTSKDQWANHEFGWDIENPKVASRYTTFKIETLPITNIDYLKFLGGQHAIDTLAEDNLPASWVKIGGDWKVRTLYGPVGLDVAGHWPLIASKVEIESYAKSKGGRLPTEVELRAFWAHPEGSRPAGHLANIGFKHWHPIPYVSRPFALLNPYPLQLYHQNLTADVGFLDRPTQSSIRTDQGCTATMVGSGNGPIPL